MRGIALGLIVAGTFAAAGNAGAYVTGDDITAQPEVQQGLQDARGYWHGRRPACGDPEVRVIDDVDPKIMGRAWKAACVISVDVDWLGSTPPERWRWCGLISHEYGHLLGLGHSDSPDDPDKVMSQARTPEMCHGLDQPAATLPRACYWPRWARSTPRVRRLYAAGHKHQAALIYRKWRRRHPRARLPGRCYITPEGDILGGGAVEGVR